MAASGSPNVLSHGNVFLRERTLGLPLHATNVEIGSNLMSERKRSPRESVKKWSVPVPKIGIWSSLMVEIGCISPIVHRFFPGLKERLLAQTADDQAPTEGEVK